MEDEQEHYLLYFGSVFLWGRQKGHSCHGLSMLPPVSFKNAISQDISSLRHAAFKTVGNWSVTGKFRRLGRESNVWVYAHSGYVKCSDATFSSFNELCGDMESVDSPEYPSCDKMEHEALQPFFLNNRRLQMYYRKTLMMPTLTLSRREFVKRQLDKVTDVINDTPGTLGTTFYSSGVHDLPPCQLDENAWSSRLAGALCDFLPEHLSGEVEYTAEDGLKFSIKQTLKSGIPNIPHLVSCYPFKGASDLVIKNKPLVIGEKVTSASASGASAGYAEVRGSDGETSGEECNVECGKQADPLSSPLPEKLGELSANMHILLLQKTIRMFRLKPIKAKSRTKVTTSGLYLNKGLGGYVCRMTVPLIEIAETLVQQQHQQKMTLSSEDLSSGCLTTEQLCFCLKRLLNTST